MLALLGVDDLFTAGLGLDIAGGYLLARSISTSAEEIFSTSASYIEVNEPLLIKQVEDKVDGRFGLFSLVGGFTIQVVAYVLDVWTQPWGQPSGMGAALVAAVTAVLGLGATLALWGLLRKKLKSREILDLAHLNGRTQRESRPLADRLSRTG